MSVLRFHELDEIATKGDIALLKADIAVLDARLGRVEMEFDELRHEVRELRSTIYRLTFATLVTLIAAMAGFQFIG
jgi:hypothetical protein